jgi:hypothetical protein
MNLSRRNLFKRLASGCVAAGLAQAALADKPGEKAFNLSLRNGRLESKDNTFRVRRGERVELRFSTDRPIQLHLHGYDIEAGGSPESPATISFTANIPGRFPVSEHAHGKGHHHRAVLYLEVQP